MFSNKSLFIFSQFILILNYLPLYLSIISIPFKLNILSIYRSYNSTNFYNFYFNRDIFLELNIGTPAKKTKAALSLDSSCFYFLNDGSNTNNYHPVKSSSFNLNDKSTTFSNLRNADDIIYFQDNNKRQKLSFVLMDSTVEKIMNNNYMPIIGLKHPFVYSGSKSFYPCPNFLYELKQTKIINKMIWTIKFDSKYNGEFILGGDLSEYDEDKYPKELYKVTYFDLKYSIIFDSIYTKHKISNRITYISDSKSSDNFRKASININSGVIIGTSEYKNFIDYHFFNNLIKRKICQVDGVDDYLIYNCRMEFGGMASPRYPTISYFEEFPDLIFKSSNLEYNFILKSYDLFEQIFGKYYFVIIFKNRTIGDDYWHLGEPFYRKFTFSINLDAKTIGFYHKKVKGKKVNKTKNNNKINKTKFLDDDDDEDEDVNKNNTDDNKSMNKILKYFIEIIIAIGIALVGYYIGITVREKRKKRANELKDENYEYMTEQNKDINENNNNQKEEKLVELNSRLGL